MSCRYLAPVISALVLVGTGSAPASDSEIATGSHLAELLRTGRSVLSAHQELINDPSRGEKDFDGDVLVDEAIALYARQHGVSPLHPALDDKQRRLTEAQLAAMREIVDEYQPLIDEPGTGFKGFIPALFGRLVNERFEEKVGDEALVKVVAPLHLVRNRRARPDEWEASIIEDKFLQPDWPRGQPFIADVESEGRPAFRMLIPEYYSASCLSCHGSPRGEMDITGYPKEGAAEGDLSGAISITLFR